MSYVVYSPRRDAFLQSELRLPSGRSFDLYTKDPQNAKTFTDWFKAKRVAARLNGLAIPAEVAEGGDSE